MSEHGSRRSFLRNSVVGAAVAVPAAGLLLTQTANAATNWNHSLSPERAFREIMRDENAHVAYLKKALSAAGATPRPKPVFKDLRQWSVGAFEQLAKTFENVGVGAYLMAAPAISNKSYLAAAGSILTIEARHAGYLDALVGVALAPNGAFDEPISQAQIVKDVSPFIASLNGGSNPADTLENDADILNFALLLEYLEADFYNTNVPRFF